MTLNIYSLFKPFILTEESMAVGRIVPYLTQESLVKFRLNSNMKSNRTECITVTTRGQI